MSNFVRFFEIPSENFSRAVSFYNELFEVKLDECDCGGEKMAFFPENEGAVIHCQGYTPSDQGVLLSLSADGKMQKMLDKIKDLGGKVLMDKSKIGGDDKGYFALFSDSEGNRLGLHSND